MNWNALDRTMPNCGKRSNAIYSEGDNMNLRRTLTRVKTRPEAEIKLAIIRKRWPSLLCWIVTASDERRYRIVTVLRPPAAPAMTEPKRYRPPHERKITRGWQLAA
jgi:hypothetical protein